MAQSKTERLLQLVLCLTQSNRFLSKGQLRRAVSDYANCPTDDAFERMFERDKNELREMGVPLVTGSADRANEDDVGYRIDREAYAMPDLRMTPDEMAAMALAARVWHEHGLAEAASRALLKLAADGTEVDDTVLPPIEARVAGEAAFGPLIEAVDVRRPVTFEYRRTGETQTVRRHVEPWGVVSRRGRWYLVGQDRDRDDVRVFRLSRISGPVTADGPAGSFVPAPDVDLRARVEAFDVTGPEQTAVLELRPDTAWGLRRRATDLGGGRVAVVFRDVDTLARELLAYGADVLVVEPASLRDLVIARLLVLAGEA